MFEKLDPYVFVTKLAGFEHTKYIQGVATHTPQDNTDIPMVQGKNIRDGFFVPEHDWFIKKDISDELPRSVLDKPCILIPYVGSNLGEVGIFPCNYKCHLASNVAKVELVSEKYSLPYLKYYLQSDIGQGYLFQNKQGSAQPNITMESIRNTSIIARNIDEQNKICGVLSAIDQKYLTNRNICSELESMAKTLYDYWFVQFDFPDENGRPYRTSGGEMVWNDQLKREIPKGWRAGKLSEIANITMGQSPAGESYNETGEGMIFYQGRTDFGMRFPTPRMYTIEPTRFAPKGDILLSVRAPVGDLNFAMEDCCIGRGLAALNSKLGSQIHLFYTLAGFQQIFGVMDGNGTTFGSITKDTLFDMGVVIPETTILKRFEEQVRSIEKKIENCETENRELTKLRDWLLPMLMNGQATVE